MVPVQKWQQVYEVMDVQDRGGQKKRALDRGLTPYRVLRVRGNITTGEISNKTGSGILRDVPPAFFIQTIVIEPKR